eukprot:SM000290S10902  [mRNA]  locus=s290:111756:114288:- [translate_table: standard]
MPEALRELPTWAKELVAGGLAGGVAKTVVAPLERVKIVLQTRTGAFRRASLGRSLGDILRAEGVRGFYRGNTASVARVVPYAALHFAAYEQYRRLLLEAWPANAGRPRVDFAAGSLAGATAVVCTYPLDLIRTRLAYQASELNCKAQVICLKVGSPAAVGTVAAGEAAALLAGGGHHRSPGIRQAFSSILREGGVRGLYRGVGPTLLGILPYAGLKFYIFEGLKGSLYEDTPPSVVAKLALGALAGIVAQTFTYPLDVVRRQMQVQGAPAPFSPAGPPDAHGGRVVYTSTWDGLRTIVRTQGWRQLYAGLTVNWIKMVPTVAVGFTVYDSVKSWLRVPPRQKARSFSAS